MVKDLATIRDRATFTKNLPLLSKVIDAFSEEPEDRFDHFGDALTYFTNGELPISFAKRIELIIHYNDPLEPDWISFRGRIREGATSHDYLSSCDNLNEGITLTYLKLCRHAGRRL